MSAFTYLYYRMYKYYDTGRDLPLFSTFVVLFVFGYFNMMSLFDLIFAVGVGLKYKYYVGKGIYRFWPLLAGTPLYMLFHYYMIKLGNHERIFDRFKDESRIESRRNGVLVVLYFIGSIGLLIGVLWLRQVVRGY